MKRITIGNDLHAWDVREDYPDLGYSHREADQITHITIHHDAASFREHVMRLEEMRIKLVYDSHTNTRGWPGIGYHLYIFPSGRVYYVGDWATVRYHTAGPDDPTTPELVSAHNEHALAICLAGDFTAKPPNKRQLDAVRKTVANVQFLFSRFLPVHGHREEEPGTQWATSCPGDTWPQWKDAVNPP